MNNIVNMHRIRSNGLRFIINKNVEKEPIIEFKKYLDTLIKNIKEYNGDNIDVFINRNKYIMDVILYLEYKNIFTRRLYKKQELRYIEKEDLIKSWNNISRLVTLYIRYT